MDPLQLFPLTFQPSHGQGGYFVAIEVLHS
jgi:hypothetical protein